MSETDKTEVLKRIEEIRLSIPERYGRWVDSNEGWHSLIVRADELMRFVAHDYYPIQIKEKFGGLDYNFHIPKTATARTEEKREYEMKHQILSIIAMHFRRLSFTVCEYCGHHGELRGQIRKRQGALGNYTVCDKCWEGLDA